MPYDNLPTYDTGASETGCCALIDPRAWDGLDLHFEDRLFVRARTHAVFHMPIDMARVFQRVQDHLKDADAFDPENFLVLSKDLGPWTSEHYFAATREVADEEMVRLSGDFVTKVFDAPFSEAGAWHDEMKDIAAERGNPDGDVFFFYTLCPKCSKHYGHNYVVGFAQV